MTYNRELVGAIYFAGWALLADQFGAEVQCLVLVINKPEAVLDPLRVVLRRISGDVHSEAATLEVGDTAYRCVILLPI